MTIILVTLKTAKTPPLHVVKWAFFGQKFASTNFAKNDHFTTCSGGVFGIFGGFWSEQIAPLGEGNFAQNSHFANFE